ncbi:MAG: hypothetical protein J6W58_09095, partial [Lachnospiraceae bacterium]|nr:hypothetical protein [Lachnospiraceae bacterium]
GIEEVVSQDDDMSGTSTSIIRDDENLSESDVTYVDEEQSGEVGNTGIGSSPKVDKTKWNINI